MAGTKRATSPSVEAPGKESIAIIIPAHNEEENLPISLPGAVREAGRENVYVVDDNSSDGTSAVALSYTPNVYSTARGGKGAAVMAGIRHFSLLDAYKGILVLDADSRLSVSALEHYRSKLEPGVAAVIGNLRVLEFQGGLISAWRRHQYFYMSNVYLRGAVAYGGGFPVTPGFCTVYSTGALGSIGLDASAPTEDIDFCWQIHRKRLGRIRFAPRALVETGVPVSPGDYVRQLVRWDRGWHYAIRKHRMPLGLQWVDFVAGAMTLEMLLFWLRGALLLLLGILAFSFDVRPSILGYDALTLMAATFVFDAAWMAVLGAVSATALRDWRLALCFPTFPLFLWFDQAVNLYSAVTLKRGLNAIWTPPGRTKGVV